MKTPCGIAVYAFYKVFLYLELFVIDAVCV